MSYNHFLRWGKGESRGLGPKFKINPLFIFAIFSVRNIMYTVFGPIVMLCCIESEARTTVVPFLS